MTFHGRASLGGSKRHRLVFFLTTERYYDDLNAIAARSCLKAEPSIHLCSRSVDSRKSCQEVGVGPASIVSFFSVGGTNHDSYSVLCFDMCLYKSLRTVRPRVSSTSLTSSKVWPLSRASPAARQLYPQLPFPPHSREKSLSENGAAGPSAGRFSLFPKRFGDRLRSRLDSRCTFW